MLDSQYNYVDKFDFCKILAFPLTWRCNARCVMCDIWKPYKTDKHFDASIIGLLSTSKMLPESLEVLSLSGGEITLIPLSALDELMAFARTLKNLHRILINTNALLPARVERLTKYLLENTGGFKISIALSIHGVHEIHDEIMGVPGAFERAIETYERLEDLKKDNPRLKISVNTVAQRKNSKYIAELLGDLANRGVRSYLSLPIWSDLWLENHRYYHEIELNEEDLAELIEVTRTHDMEFAERLLRNSVRDQPCTFKERGAFVNPEGDLYACGYTKDSFVGSLADASFDELWEKSRAIRLKSEPFNDVCKKCLALCFSDTY